MTLALSSASPASLGFAPSTPGMSTLPFHHPGEGPETTTIAMLQTPASNAGASRPPHRQIHRNRASYSCHSCRRRKVKCDRQHPTCGNCQKMAEGCVYADNTGKGVKNKKKDRQTSNNSLSSSSSTSCASPDAIECPGSPPKRLRTNSGASIALTSEDEACSYRSHSRSSSMNQSEFHSPFPSPDPTFVASGSLPPPPPPPPTNLLTSLIKEGELETRVNRLAEIVDQWYKVAYSHSQPGSPPNGFSPELVGNTPRRWPVSPAAQQLHEYPRQQSLDVCGQLTPKHSPVLGRIHDPKTVAAPQQNRKVSVSSTHFASSKDGGEEVAMGHLSIQENGRSRYVGTSFMK